MCRQTTGMTGELPLMSLWMQKTSDEQTVQAGLNWSPAKSVPLTVEITPSSASAAPEAPASSPEQPLQPLSPIGADFFNLVQFCRPQA